ncbi:MAG: type II toxin-antitoxin system Phd/YefM family antitoxin [Planctomycetes bacterium]|nr:type II toxin-antitoxin system Phd/YefM family antitoxin [Planctomycetota bacterium]
MLDVSQDIHSLTEFKTRTPEFLARLQQSERAVLLTVNGKAEIAVMSAATFQHVLEALRTLDAIRGIEAGLEDMKAGRTRPADDFFAELRRKRGLAERPE